MDGYKHVHNLKDRHNIQYLPERPSRVRSAGGAAAVRPLERDLRSFERDRRTPATRSRPRERDRERDLRGLPPLPRRAYRYLK